MEHFFAGFVKQAYPAFTPPKVNVSKGVILAGVKGAPSAAVQLRNKQLASQVATKVPNQAAPALNAVPPPPKPL